MDNQRIILFFALSFVLLLLWQAWQRDYGNQPPASPPTSAESAINEQPVTAKDVPVSPPTDNQQQDSLQDAATPAAPPEIHDALNSAQRIHVVTDLLGVDIDTIGGDIRQVDLLAYPVSADKKDVPFRLMHDKGESIFIAQSGLLSKQQALDHHTVLRAEKNDYQLADDAQQLKVPLKWTSPDGIVITKTYTFHRNSYVIDVTHEVHNSSSAEWRGHQYRQFQRTPLGDGEKPKFIYTYTGGVIYSTEEKYEKIKFEDMEKKDLSRDIKNGWGAMIQHYFLSAWIPQTDETNHYYSKAPASSPYVLGLISPEIKVNAGETGQFNSRLYVGPKEQHRLEKVAPGLKLTVDYGVLTVIAQPIFWLLEKIHSFLGNWGWSIIVLTLFIKLLFYKLSETSYKSMANMRRMQPKIQTLRERFGDDRQRMSQAMMELYKKEKINPLGGCLPILVQIPVFISLYWVLLESVELRQAHFMFWINDLSVKDPYYILPLLMGATMFVQQQLNPAPPDPIQAKVMKVLPVVFTLFFAFFPSGLVLYWVANSLLSILQQWYITRNIEKAARKTA